MPSIIRAVAMAPKSHRLINSALDLENQQIIYKKYVDLGLTVDTERGFVVPVLRDADDQNQVHVRLMMPLSLSYNHRLVDGAVAARFLND